MFDEIIKILYNKRGIEFGGPTELFSNIKYKLDLYNNVHLDGGNLLNDNSFSNLPGHENRFEYYKYGNNIGKQYDVDCANENSIKKIGRKYDFIVTSHVIEHIANPIKSLINWKEILDDENGYILSIIPDYKYCFDRKRPLTTIEHLIDDYKSDIKEDDTTHINEQINLHDWSLGGHPDFHKLCIDNYKTRVVHHHTFDISLVENMFIYSGYEVLVSYKHDDLNIINLSKKIKN
jgi:hypothetical protein